MVSRRGVAKPLRVFRSALGMAVLDPEGSPGAFSPLGFDSSI